MRSQLGDFLSNEGVFEDMKSKISRERQDSKRLGKPMLPGKVWNLYNRKAPELSAVAQCLVRLVPTEAAAERSFSAQADVHSADRNRLAPSIIESEMMVKWNWKRLANRGFIGDDDEEMSDGE